MELFFRSYGYLTERKPTMPLMPDMRRSSIPKPLAPAPRLTLWVPVLIAAALCLFWLGLLALTYR